MPSLDNLDLAVPQGSTVLVTGVNGLVGSHIADQFLDYGYKVRGTARDVEKTAWIVDLFDKKYGKGKFELAKAGDMVTEGVFDEVVKGVSIVAHCASVTSLDFNPHNVIPVAIAGAINALKAAYAEPSVKRFVLTSSSAATVISAVDKPGITITAETWNEDAVKAAWAEPPYTPERIGPVYAASKTQAEQEVWKYYREHQSERPDLVVNTVLPNMNYGKVVDPVHQGFPSSASMIALLYNGQVTDFHRVVPRQYFIDTQDTGRLHVAAGILEKVKGQRIFGFAEPVSWDAILEILRKVQPEKTFPENFSGGEDTNVIALQDEAEQLLRDLGRPGWTTLESSIRGAVEDLREVEKAQAAA
ncbi:hypothetical protein ACJ41O_001303 [Fusarium nematophilum]